MSRSLTLALDVVIEAPVETVWAAVVDWEAQSGWMLGTRVWATERDGVGVDGGVAAFTGLAGVGFLDTMRITRWEPPHRCDVLHTGRVVRGTGSFEVVPLPGGRSRFVWSEQLVPPFGLLGWLAWGLVRPFAEAGVRRSLDRLGRSLARR